jgi:phosphoglycolate phosphatase-like HAD superfamily hydrolase
MSERALPRAILFDLEEALLDRREAWRYTIEQVIGVTCHRRVDARPLVAEYAPRPPAHALAVLCESLDERLRCQRLWPQIYYRSALKRLTVHDGVGRALDRLVLAGVELGVVSRESHADARKAMESTGIDRFMSVMSAAVDDGHWPLAERVAPCLTFLEREPGQAMFVSCRDGDLGAAEDLGLTTLPVGWAGARRGDAPATARELFAAVEARWREASGERRARNTSGHPA